MAFVLGTVSFGEWEAPERIPWGGSQRVVTQRTLGGKRYVNVMGPDYAPLAWEGRFRGPLAMIRARQLDLMRAGGKTHVLTWDTFAYEVVIESFEANYEAFFEIPYRMSCVVVRDLVADVAYEEVSSLADQIMGDLSDATGLATDSPILTGAVTATQAAVYGTMNSGRFELSTLTGSVLAGLQATAGASLGTAADAATTTNAAVSTGSVGGVSAGGDAASMVTRLSEQVATVDTAYKSVAVRNLLGRLNDNLGRAGL